MVQTERPRFQRPEEIAGQRAFVITYIVNNSPNYSRRGDIARFLAGDINVTDIQGSQLRSWLPNLEWKHDFYEGAYSREAVQINELTEDGLFNEAFARLEAAVLEKQRQGQVLDS